MGIKKQKVQQKKKANANKVCPRKQIKQGEFERIKKEKMRQEAEMKALAERMKKLKKKDDEYETSEYELSEYDDDQSDESDYVESDQDDDGIDLIAPKKNK